jgi:hypothetical protein
MRKEEVEKLFEKFKSIDFNQYLSDDLGENGKNPKIIIQVIDDNFEFGYWDYFYASDITNKKWFAEFKKQFDLYLQEVSDAIFEEKNCDIQANVTEEEIYAYIDNINIFVAYFDNIDDCAPYGFWNVIDGFYESVCS